MPRGKRLAGDISTASQPKRVNTSSQPSSAPTTGNDVQGLNRVKTARPCLTKPRPAHYSAAFQNKLATQVQIDQFKASRHWLPMCGATGIPTAEEGSWKRKLFEAMVDCSQVYDTNNHFFKGTFTDEEMEFGIAMVWAAIVELHTNGTDMHPIIDPTVKAVTRSSVKRYSINSKSRDMTPVERLQAIEAILRVDKKVCQDVVLAVDPKSVIKIIVAAPWDSAKTRNSNFDSNSRRGLKGKGVSTVVNPTSDAVGSNGKDNEVQDMKGGDTGIFDPSLADTLALSKADSPSVPNRPSSQDPPLMTTHSSRQVPTAYAEEGPYHGQTHDALTMSPVPFMVSPNDPNYINTYGYNTFHGNIDDQPTRSLSNLHPRHLYSQTISNAPAYNHYITQLGFEQQTYQQSPASYHDCDYYQ